MIYCSDIICRSVIRSNFGVSRRQQGSSDSQYIYNGPTGGSILDYGIVDPMISKLVEAVTSSVELTTWATRTDRPGSPLVPQTADMPPAALWSTENEQQCTAATKGQVESRPHLRIIKTAHIYNKSSLSNKLIPKFNKRITPIEFDVISTTIMHS